MKSRFSKFPNFSESEKVNILSYWDNELICRFANQEFFKFFGKPMDEIIGKVYLRNLFEPMYEQHLPYIKGVLKGYSQNYESEIFLPPKGKQRVVSTYYPDIEDGYVLGFFAHITNIKEFTNSEQFGYGMLSLNKDSKIIGAIFSQNNRIYEVASYLKSQILSEFPSVEYLAELHAISVSKLMRDFKNTFQTSPYLYYRRLQMEFAEVYMEKTGCSKKQMSAMLGFSNPTNFVVCYKKYLLDTNSAVPGLKIVENGEKKKISISQLPFPVVMLDLQLNYLEVSEEWITEFNFNGVNLLGTSVFDNFPGAMNDVEKIRKKYSESGLTQCGGEILLHTKTDNREIKCIIKQWYAESGDLGGIIVYSV